jgi:RND family efflux transporter MFP subunit
LGFLGQFSAIEQVELRAQVGGTLTGVYFKDGDIVHKGDLLFTIDARPYEIRLAQGKAQLETANARLALAERELTRAQVLATKQFGTEQTVDQRTADQRSAQAAVDDAKARSATQSSISSIAASPRPSRGASAPISSPSAI